MRRMKRTKCMRDTDGYSARGRMGEGEREGERKSERDMDGSREIDE